MKVLFAVSTEDIAEKIVKVYQTEYKEIITSKNVYYFNAIIKELQRNQTYEIPYRYFPYYQFPLYLIKYKLLYF